MDFSGKRKSRTSAGCSTYEINVVAVGSTENNPNTFDTYYILSNKSSALIITLPASPVLQAKMTTNGVFSGKGYWAAIQNADYYKVYVKYHDDALNNDQSKIQIFDATAISSDMSHEGYKAFKTTNTYFNLVYAGAYDIIVVASQNKDGYQSQDSNKLSNIEYALFDAAENGKDIPYTINDMEHFNAIQYNPGANYVLGVASFDIESLEIICGEDNMFAGTFDGNNATINLSIPSTNNTFIGLFGYIANGAVVKDFTLNVDIHSVAQTDSAIYVGSVAGFNHGTIQNISVNGTVSSEYNDGTTYIYNGGVVAVNYGTISYVLSKVSVLPKNNSNTVYAGGIATINNGGTIEKSGFRGIASAQIVGGIVSQNLGGQIEQCYYETDGSIQTSITSSNDGSSYNAAGGIAGYMNGGLITYCYANGRITANSISSEYVYAGGLVGYVDRNSSIGASFVVGYDSSNAAQISATGLYAYTGVFVGDSDVDCSVNWLTCVKTNAQKFIGNSKKTLSFAESTTDLKAALSIKMNVSNYFILDDAQSAYPYLKNAKYN